MRYLDFKLLPETRMYVEANSEAETAKKDLTTLEKVLTDLPEEQNQTKENIIGKLQQMSSAVQNFISKIVGQPVKEDKLDDSIAGLIDTLRQQIQQVEDSDIDESTKSKFIAPIRQNLEALTGQVEKLTKVKDQAVATAEEAKAFVQQVSGYLVTLGNKVQGYTESDLESLSGKERALAKSAAVNAQKFSNTLKQALFGKIVDIQEQGIKPDDIKTFLQACVDGEVIDMKQLINNSTGNVRDFVKEKHLRMFDIFVSQNIFSYSPGSTSGNIGPGEMALSMMGNPAEKGKTGDLLIDGKELEIKAGGVKGSGGRLNSKALTKPTTGWKVFSKHISEILQNAPDEPLTRVPNAKTGKVVTITKSLKGWDGNFKSASGKTGSAYNFLPTIIPLLNAEVLGPYSDKQKTTELFVESFKAMTGNWDKLKIEGTTPEALIADAVKSDGTTEFVDMAKAWARIAYESYHLADGIESIMFLRTDSLNFVIVDDGTDFIRNFGNLKVSGFVWNDDQQNPTPGFLPAN
jgi:hypothetical protein